MLYSSWKVRSLDIYEVQQSHGRDKKPGMRNIINFKRGNECKNRKEDR